MKLFVIAALALSLTGCGAVNRIQSSFTGDGSEVCQSGVIYLQFVSGVSVKYNRDGSIATCD